MAPLSPLQRLKSLSLFYKLLGFLILCLVCSGIVAAWLVTQQMSTLVYTQAHDVFKNDRHITNIFLKEHQIWLRKSAADIGQDENLLIAVELDVVEEVQSIAKDFKTLLGVDEVVVTNTQGRVLSRGYDFNGKLDPEMLNRFQGVLEVGGNSQVFSRALLRAEEVDEPVGHVVLLQTLTDNRRFFLKLRESIGKDAFLFFTNRDEIGMSSVNEVGSTFAELPGVLERSPIEAGLFTAYDNQYIGIELDLDDAFSHEDWSVVFLQSAAPLIRSIGQVKWGTVIFTLVFIGLIAGVIGLFFAAHIRKPMASIGQGLAAITQGNLETRLQLNRRDEWHDIEEALNSMTSSLSDSEMALQRKVIETTTLYEIGQDVAAQTDLDATLNLIVERAMALLGGEHAMLALRQADSDTFLFQAQSGVVNSALTSVRLRPGQGLGGRVISTGMPVLVGDYPVEYADSPFLQIVQESGMRSWLGVPLHGQDEVIGVLYVNSTKPNLFDEEGQLLLSALGDQAAIAIEKTQLYEQIRAHAAELEIRVTERTAELATAHDEILALNDQLKAENLRMGAELEVTRQLQLMVLPTPEELSAVDSLDIAAYMEPADEVGGDYYDVLSDKGQVKIGIGDVTGHGLESGMVMLMTQMAVRTLLTSGESDPVRFLDILNRTLFANVQRMGTDKNLTLSLIDYADGEVKLSGQHEEMIVVRQSGVVELVDTVDLGFPIGLDEDIAAFVSQMTVKLARGDGVVLYTDGITEAENATGMQYGLERLCAVVGQHWGQSADSVKEAVIQDVQAHINGHEIYDDITLVVVKQR